MSGRNPEWGDRGGFNFWDRVRADQAVQEAPWVECSWKGSKRRFPAHYEESWWGMQLVPDSEDGIDFAQTVDGKWYAYETQR